MTKIHPRFRYYVVRVPGLFGFGTSIKQALRNSLPEKYQAHQHFGAREITCQKTARRYYPENFKGIPKRDSNR